MEAIIVSPAPVKLASPNDTTTKSPPDAETAFAPTLEKAINKKNPAKSSAEKPGEEARVANQPDGAKSKEIEGDDEVNAAAGQPANQQQTDTEVASSQSGTNAQTSTVTDDSDGNRHALTAAGRTVDKTMVDANSPKTETLTSEKDLPSLEKFPIGSVKARQVAAPQSALVTGITDKQAHQAKDATPSANAASLRIQAQSAEARIADGKPLSLQEGDSVIFSAAKTNESQSFLKSSTAFQLSREATAAFDSADSSATIQTQRVQASLQSSAAFSFKSADSPLSAEVIFARLSDVSLQNNPPRGLRENTLSLRQENVQGQFINAKIQQFENGGDTKADQQLLGQESGNTPQTLVTPSGQDAEKPGESLFSQTFHNITSDKPGPGMETFRPGSTFLPTQFQEVEILNQIAQKFRISRQLQDSKLVMKLHPAELGDLKIDIQLKSGSVNANILVQSQQVQEILEKHLPRLKTLMENQGLTVNEISINLETDFADKKNMFDDQLAQNDREFTEGRNTSASNTFSLDLEQDEEAGMQLNVSEPGVNVLI